MRKRHIEISGQDDMYPTPYHLTVRGLGAAAGLVMSYNQLGNKKIQVSKWSGWQVKLGRYIEFQNHLQRLNAEPLSSSQRFTPVQGMELT